MVDLAALDEVFGALADRTRRGIVARLARGPVGIAVLAGPLPMSLQAVSKHVGVLETAGLVRREKVGREHVITLNAARLRSIDRWLEHYRRFWEGKLDALAAYVEANPDIPPEPPTASLHSSASSPDRPTPHAPPPPPTGAGGRITPRRSRHGRAHKRRRR